MNAHRSWLLPLKAISAGVFREASQFLHSRRLDIRKLPAAIWPCLLTLSLCSLLINCRNEVNFGTQNTTGPNITAALIPETVCLFNLHAADSYWVADSDWVNVAAQPPTISNAAYSFGISVPGNANGPITCTLTTTNFQCADKVGNPALIIPTNPAPSYSVNILECPNQMSSCTVLQIPNSSGGTQPANFPIPGDGFLLTALQGQGFQVASEDATYQIQPLLDLHKGGLLTGPSDGSLNVVVVPAGMTGRDFTFPLGPGGTNDGWISGQAPNAPFPVNFSTSLQVTEVHISSSMNSHVPFCGVTTAQNRDCGCNEDPSFTTGPCDTVKVDNNCSNSVGTVLTPISRLSEQPSPVDPNATLTWEPIFAACHADVPDPMDNNLSLTIHFKLEQRPNLPIQTAPKHCPTQ